MRQHTIVGRAHPRPPPAHAPGGADRARHARALGRRAATRTGCAARRSRWARGSSRLRRLRRDGAPARPYRAALTPRTRSPSCAAARDAVRPRVWRTALAVGDPTLTQLCQGSATLALSGRADDPRGGGDHRLVAAHAALRRARRAGRARPLGVRLPPLRTGRAAAAAHPARAARPSTRSACPTSPSRCACGSDPELRRATDAWLEAEAERPADVPASDWLRFEQEKHQRCWPPPPCDPATRRRPHGHHRRSRPTTRSPTSRSPRTAARRSSSPSTRCPA